MSTQFPHTENTGTRIPDTMGKEGAMRLCVKIKAYWAARGRDAAPWIEPFDADQAGSKGAYVVRSNMVGGQPA